MDYSVHEIIGFIRDLSEEDKKAVKKWITDWL